MEPNLLFDLGYYAPLEGSHVWVVGSIQQLLLCYPDVFCILRARYMFTSRAQVKSVCTETTCDYFYQ